MTKYAIGIEYAGSAYCGWQRQRHCLSIQQQVEDAMSFVADHKIQLICAGRTDAGVHAVEQVAHFESDSQRSERAWVLGSNTRMNRDIRVKWVVPVVDTFNARFSAIARSYRYIINNNLIPCALFHGRAAWEFRKLDVEKMQAAAQVLIGERDFSAFRAAGCQAKTAHRNIHSINLVRRGDLIYCDIKANAFLYHMVRNIVGSLVLVGCGERSIGWIEEILNVKDRNQAGITAAASGLYFLRAYYPGQYKIPHLGKEPVLF